MGGLHRPSAPPLIRLHFGVYSSDDPLPDTLDSLVDLALSEWPPSPPLVVMEVTETFLLKSGRVSFLLKRERIHCAILFQWYRLSISEKAQLMTRTTRQEGKGLNYTYSGRVNYTYSGRVKLYIQWKG